MTKEINSLDFIFSAILERYKCALKKPKQSAKIIILLYLSLLSEPQTVLLIYEM